jgi:hypothetical protein
VANKALGRDLRDLLSRARPMRFVERAAGVTDPDNATPPAAAEPESVPPLQPLELPFDRPRPRDAEPGSPASVPAPPVAPSIVAPPLEVFAAAQEAAQAPLLEPGRSTTLWFPLLLASDVAFLATAVFLVFDPRVRRPLGWYLAGAAVLAGAVCGSLAFAVRARRRSLPAAPKANVRVHVHLTRV